MAATPGSQVSVCENQQPKIQIYAPCNDEVSDFWREKYEKDAKKYWDIFYKRHQDKFFKDRHYLDNEWGHHFSGEGRTVVLEEIPSFLCLQRTQIYLYTLVIFHHELLIWLRCTRTSQRPKSMHLLVTLPLIIYVLMLLLPPSTL